MFHSCEICGAADWQVLYEGPVRAGAFGSEIPDGKVAVCLKCRAARLAEDTCIVAQAYETEEYRVTLGQGLSPQEYFERADPMQIQNLAAVWPLSLRNQVVADVGCGAGSFLDHVAGLASEIIAIEPTAPYHDSLRQRGYEVYSYIADAAKARPNSVDVAVSFQVIEHVRDPREFLSEIAKLLRPGGALLIATPNRDEILLKLLPTAFPSFFYRIVHRWYFDKVSLGNCVRAAGLRIESERFQHTLGMSNAFAWLRERRPTGEQRLPGIDSSADVSWKRYLEMTGQADTLLVLARKEGGAPMMQAWAEGCASHTSAS